MKRHVAVFWGTAVATTVLFAILSALLLPFESLGLHTVADRERAWLLTLWTAGVLAILFGASALLGAFGGIGVREVLEAGSVRTAMEIDRQSRTRWGGGEFHRSFGWWLVSTGALLVASYFAAWIFLE